MQLLLGKFLGLLDDEIGLYGTLLLTLQREKRAVVASNLNALSESSKEKESLFLKIRILEEQRLALIGRLAQELAQEAQSLTLTKLAQLVEEPYATGIRNRQSSFLSLAQSIQEINLSNKALLDHSLDVVRGSLSLLHDLMPSCPFYYRTGKMPSGDQIGKLLSGKA
ncbi:MAG: flagellar protein FlgN [Thermodesulfobacteriota bacterium]|nr:flagellar protein FlgN [Thermodesulfobacteriota bacterium]